MNRGNSNENWTKTTLGEVADYFNGRAFKPSEWEKTGLPIIRIQNLNKADAAYNFSSKEYERRYKISHGDLLFAWSASLGAFIWKGKDAWLNQHIFKVESKPFCSKKFLYYLLTKIVTELYSMTHGSGMVHITKGKFENTEVYLPPLAEQHRIVAKIEELFSSLDNAIESINTAKEQLKVYRQAVLKWAFEYATQISSRYLLSEISEKIQIGPFGSQLHKEDYIEGGVPLINPMHIKNGKIIKDDSYSITIEKRNSLPNYILKKGDIIMGRRGEMARCGLVSEKEEGWFCGTGSLFIRPKTAIVNSVFLFYQLSSEITRSFLEENAGGTTMANLNLKIVNGIPISLPSIDEQNRIVRDIERRLSVCDKIEEGIENSLLQADALRQSILKRAFEGKLVPQDPNDEPASKLLERIKAEREKSVAVKVKKERKTKS